MAHKRVGRKGRGRKGTSAQLSKSRSRKGMMNTKVISAMRK